MYSPSVTIVCVYFLVEAGQAAAEFLACMYWTY